MLFYKLIHGLLTKHSVFIYLLTYQIYFFMLVNTQCTRYKEKN